MIGTTRCETKTPIVPWFSLMSIVSLYSRMRRRGLFARPLRLIRGAPTDLVGFPETPLEPYELRFLNRIVDVWARAARRSM
jgi:hypothetical protein